MAVWELATTGWVTMPSGARWQVEPKEWLETVKWIYAHIDGPPKQAHSLEGPDGGPVRVIFEESENWRGNSHTLSDPKATSGTENDL